MEEEIDLRDLIKYFWSKKKLIILVGVLCVIFSVVYTKFLLTPEYSATSKFILTNNNLATEADVYLYSKLPDRYYAIVTSKNVFDKVVKNLELDIKDEMEFREKNVIITHSPANFMISVSVNTNDAKKSAQIANEIVKVSIEKIKEVYNDEKIQILDYAVEDFEPINIDLIGNTIKFIMIGEVLVCGFVLIRYIFIERFKNNITINDKKDK